jgi:hypothetical protein
MVSLSVVNCLEEGGCVTKPSTVADVDNAEANDGSMKRVANRDIYQGMKIRSSGQAQAPLHTQTKRVPHSQQAAAIVAMKLLITYLLTVASVIVAANSISKTVSPQVLLYKGTGNAHADAAMCMNGFSSSSVSIPKGRYSHLGKSYIRSSTGEVSGSQKTTDKYPQMMVSLPTFDFTCHNPDTYYGPTPVQFRK